MTETTAPPAAPAPGAPSAKAQEIVDRMKQRDPRGRHPKGCQCGRPACKGKSADGQPKETPTTTEEKPKASWTEDALKSSIEKLCKLGVRSGVPEWGEISAEDRELVAPHLLPFAQKWLPEPGKANWLVTLGLVLLIFGNAILATLERIQTVAQRVGVALEKIQERLSRIFKRKPAAPAPAAKPAETPPQSHAVGEAVLAPQSRPEL